MAFIKPLERESKKLQFSNLYVKLLIRIIPTPAKNCHKNFVGEHVHKYEHTLSMCLLIFWIERYAISTKETSYDSHHNIYVQLSASAINSSFLKAQPANLCIN